MRGRDKFEKLKPIIMLLVYAVKLLPRKVIIKFFHRARNVKGYIGLVKRYVYLKSISPNCGDNVGIYENVYLLNPDQFECGDNVSIHPMCYIDAVGGVTVGNDVSVAHGVTILSSTHNYKDSTVNIKDQGLTLKKTRIGNNVWIGAKVTILAGTTVNNGCVIGAGAVITKDCDENSVYAGVPARKIKMRVGE